MSGVICERYPACHESTNSPQPPKCDRPGCPGRPTFAPIANIGTCPDCGGAGRSEKEVECATCAGNGYVIKSVPHTAGQRENT